MSFTVYTFEDRDGTASTHKTLSIQAARDFAQKYHLKVVANTCQVTKEEVVEDYTGQDEAETPTLTD